MINVETRVSWDVDEGNAQGEKSFTTEVESPASSLGRVWGVARSQNSQSSRCWKGNGELQGRVQNSVKIKLTLAKAPGKCCAGPFLVSCCRRWTAPPSTFRPSWRSSRQPHRCAGCRSCRQRFLNLSADRLQAWKMLQGRRASKLRTFWKMFGKFNLNLLGLQRRSSVFAIDLTL